MTLPTPEHMFTTAVSPHAADQVVFLFNHLQAAPADFDEILSYMWAHPVLKEVCALGVVVPLDSQRDEFQVSTDLEAHLYPEDYTQLIAPVIYLGDTSGGVKPLNMLEVFYSCKLPHRDILGCRECMDLPTVTECAAKFWYKIYKLRRHANTLNWAQYSEPGAVRQALKNREDTLGKYVFISPRLTRPARENFTKTDRLPDAHDFSEVPMHSATARKAGRERTRYRRFQQEVCPACLAHQTCQSRYFDPRWCKGAYRLSEQEAIQKLNQEYLIPYEAQLVAQLLDRHCGALPFRVDRKMAHLSCYVPYGTNELKFGIVYDYEGGFHSLSLSDLTDLIRRLPEPVRPSTPLTDYERALLIELASRTETPQENGYWTKTRYSTFFIDRCAIDGLRLHFRFNTKRTNREWEMPWTIGAKCFGDIFAHYRNFKTLLQETHPLRKVWGECF